MCKDSIVFNNRPKSVALEADVEYFICQCGRSKDGVFCDGSHEGTECLPKAVTLKKTNTYHICLCKTSHNFPFCDGNHSYYTDDEVGKPIKQF